MMRKYNLYLYLFLLLFASSPLRAENYNGRVVDQNGQAVSFATVYLLHDPVVGTASGSDGSFVITTSHPATDTVIVSFIGYEKYVTTLSQLGSGDVVLREQPIALEEMVVTAKPSKQKNKRKQMAQLLYRVYARMQVDFPDTPTRYKIVSDVRMNSEDTPWGMEQMIATAVNLPGQGREGRDSVQFAGEYCKRFFQQQIRDRADVILEGDKLDKDLRKMANAVDSGVVVHYGLWSAGNIRYDFQESMNDLRHWTVSNESETETVLTHTEKKNYIGIFKYEYKRHYILDSETLSVLRFSEELDMALNIPFGYKFRKSDLELLNLLNMSENNIEKFRLKKARAHVTLNTIYRRVASSGSPKICPQEKNLGATAVLLGTKQMEIPVDVKATQRVISVNLDASPLPKSALTRRVKREIVPIY